MDQEVSQRKQSGESALDVITTSDGKIAVCGRTDFENTTDAFLMLLDTAGYGNCASDTVDLPSNNFVPSNGFPIGGSIFDNTYETPTRVITLSNANAMAYGAACNCAFPLADFSVTTMALPSITIENTSSNTTWWYWTFGDGTADTLSQTVTHEFSEFGTYAVCLVAVNDCGIDQHCQSFDFVNTDEKLEGHSDVAVYPNTAENTIVIRASFDEELVVVVTDLCGRQLIQAKARSNEPLSVETLAAGMYVVSVNSSKGTFVHNLTVSR